MILEYTSRGKDIVCVAPVHSSSSQSSDKVSLLNITGSVKTSLPLKQLSVTSRRLLATSITLEDALALAVALQPTLLPAPSHCHRFLFGVSCATDLGRTPLVNAELEENEVPAVDPETKICWPCAKRPSGHSRISIQPGSSSTCMPSASAYLHAAASGACARDQLHVQSPGRARAQRRTHRFMSGRRNHHHDCWKKRESVCVYAGFV